MRLMLGIAILCFYVFGISCNKLAAPVEAVFAYYAYQAEVLQKGVGRGDCLPGFTTGSMSDGSATFDEFLKQTQKTNTAYNLVSTAGKERIPDWDKVSTELHRLKWSAGVDLQKAYPQRYPVTSANKGLAPSFQEVANRFKNTLMQAAAAKPDDPDMKKLVASSHDAAVRAEKARYADNLDKLKQASQTRLQSIDKNYKLKLKTTTLGYLTMEEIDIKETALLNMVDDAPTMDKLAKALKAVDQKYWSKPANKLDKSALKAWAHVEAQKIAGNVVTDLKGIC